MSSIGREKLVSICKEDCACSESTVPLPMERLTHDAKRLVEANIIGFFIVLDEWRQKEDE